MILLETNGGNVRAVPRHPQDTGACPEDEPCEECAAAYALGYDVDYEGAADEAWRAYLDAMASMNEEV